MSKNDFISLCNQPADAAHLEQLDTFLDRLHQTNRSHIPHALKNLCLTELLVFFLFRLLTQIPCRKLFFSMYPVLLMIFFAYFIAVSAMIIQGSFYEKKMKQLLHQPESISYAPGSYTFLHEKRTRVGNDVSSPTIRSALFSHPAFPENVSASLKSTGFFFDFLEEGKNYTLFSVNHSYVLFIRNFPGQDALS